MQRLVRMREKQIFKSNDENFPELVQNKNLQIWEA